MKTKYIATLLILTLLIGFVPTSIVSAAGDIIITTDSEYNIGYADQATYKSSDTKIITVSKNGIVKGVKAGRASVTVKTKGKNSVKQTLNFAVKESSITNNGQKALDAKVYYEDNQQKSTSIKKDSPIISGENVIVNYSTTLKANKPVIWSVSDSTKATVSNTTSYTTTCKITGLQQGALFIIATDKNGYTTKLPYVVTAKTFFTITPSPNYKITTQKDWFTGLERVCFITISKTGTYSFNTTLKSNIKYFNEINNAGYKSGFKIKFNSDRSFTLSGKPNRADNTAKYHNNGITLCTFTATSIQTGEKIMIVFEYK